MNLRTILGFISVFVALAQLAACEKITVKESPLPTGTESSPTPASAEGPIDVTVPAPSMTECGLSGSVAARLKDCTRLANSTSGEWQLLSKSDDSAPVWMNPKTGLVMTDPVLAESGNYFESRDICLQLSLEGVALRVPTLSEWNSIKDAQELRYPDGEYWTSTRNNKGWMKMVSRSTRVSYADPNYYEGKVRCFGALTNRVDRSPYAFMVSDREYRFKADCERLDQTEIAPDDFDLAKSLSQSDAKAYCGEGNFRVGEMQTTYGCLCRADEFFCYRHAFLNAETRCGR